MLKSPRKPETDPTEGMPLWLLVAATLAIELPIFLLYSLTEMF